MHTDSCFRHPTAKIGRETIPRNLLQKAWLRVAPVRLFKALRDCCDIWIVSKASPYHGVALRFRFTWILCMVLITIVERRTWWGLRIPYLEGYYMK
jgi:hypothetical protein